MIYISLTNSTVREKIVVYIYIYIYIYSNNSTCVPSGHHGKISNQPSIVFGALTIRRHFVSKAVTVMTRDSDLNGVMYYVILTIFALQS